MAQHYFFLGLASARGRAWPAQFPEADQPDTNGSTILTLTSNQMPTQSSLLVERSFDNIWLNVRTGVVCSDADVLLRMRHRSKAPSSYNYVNTGGGLYLRSDGAGGSTGTGYYVSFGSPPQYANDVNIYRRDPSAQTDLGGGTWTATISDLFQDIVNLRVQIIGDAIKVKAWLDTESEPASWDLERTDATYTSGELGILLHGYLTYEFYSLAVGTEGDAIPSETSYPITGTVLDESGLPGAFTVRAIHRATGLVVDEVMSDGVTGAFSLTVPTQDEYQRIVLDAEGGVLLNDLIDRVMP
jgi:hypothetical protein